MWAAKINLFELLLEINQEENKVLILLSIMKNAKKERKLRALIFQLLKNLTRRLKENFKAQKKAR